MHYDLRFDGALAGALAPGATFARAAATIDPTGAACAAHAIRYAPDTLYTPPATEAVWVARNYRPFQCGRDADGSTIHVGWVQASSTLYIHRDESGTALWSHQYRSGANADMLEGGGAHRYAPRALGKVVDGVVTIVCAAIETTGGTDVGVAVLASTVTRLVADATDFDVIPMTLASDGSETDDDTGDAQETGKGKLAGPWALNEPFTLNYRGDDPDRLIWVLTNYQDKNDSPTAGRVYVWVSTRTAGAWTHGNIVYFDATSISHTHPGAILSLDGADDDQCYLVISCGDGVGLAKLVLYQCDDLDNYASYDSGYEHWAVVDDPWYGASGKPGGQPFMGFQHPSDPTLALAGNDTSSMHALAWLGFDSTPDPVFTKIWGQPTATGASYGRVHNTVFYARAWTPWTPGPCVARVSADSVASTGDQWRSILYSPDGGLTWVTAHMFDTAGTSTNVDVLVTDRYIYFTEVSSSNIYRTPVPTISRQRPAVFGPGRDNLAMDAVGDDTPLGTGGADWLWSDDVGYAAPPDTPPSNGLIAHIVVEDGDSDGGLKRHQVAGTGTHAAGTYRVQWRGWLRTRHDVSGDDWPAQVTLRIGLGTQDSSAWAVNNPIALGWSPILISDALTNSTSQSIQLTGQWSTVFAEKQDAELYVCNDHVMFDVTGSFGYPTAMESSSNPHEALVAPLPDAWRQSAAWSVWWQGSNPGTGFDSAFDLSGENYPIWTLYADASNYIEIYAMTAKVRAKVVVGGSPTNLEASGQSWWPQRQSAIGLSYDAGTLRLFASSGGDVPVMASASIDLSGVDFRSVKSGDNDQSDLAEMAWACVRADTAAPATVAAATQAFAGALSGLGTVGGWRARGRGREVA